NCHQLGDKATREMPAALDVAKASSVEAWTRRLQSGPGGGSMVRFIGLMNTNDGGHLRRLAEWTDRIRAGALPASAPPRPHGVAVLRHRAGLGVAGQLAQTDDGSGRARLLDRADPLAQESAGVLRGGFRSSVGQDLSARARPGRLRAELPSGHGVRPEDEAIH